MKKRVIVCFVLGLVISIGAIGCGIKTEESNETPALVPTEIAEPTDTRDQQTASEEPVQTTLAEAISKYKPGTYTSKMELKNATLDLEVTVDQNHVTSVKFLNLDSETEEKYPLLEPCLESITSQLYAQIPIDDILVADHGKYTSIKILDTIKKVLEQAY
ncbi:MAG: hypothetical protein Q4G58_11515 [bacterium]|nr:hypothetical protein [bacterium]